jgi:hypothetical protein
MNFIEIVQDLTMLSPAILSTGIVVGLYKYKLLNDITKSIILYFIVMLALDITGRILEDFGNNFIILHTYSFLELLLLLYFYFKFLFKARHNILLGLGIIGILYIIWEIVIFNQVKAKDFQPYSKTLDNFIVILLALAFLQEKITRFKESKWDNFQLNIVILIFFTLNLIFFLPFNFLVNESTGLKFYFWLGNLILTLSFYSYLTYSIWKNARIAKHPIKKKAIS